MRRIERVCNLDRKRQKQISLKGPPGNSVLQHDAVQKLRGDEGFSVLLADVINGADVGVIECGGSLGFTLKTAERLRIAGNLIRQELERNKSVQADVFGFVDHTHPAHAKLLDDVIVRDRLADHWAEILGPGMGQVN